jgi:hypothetical protein
MTFIVHTSKMIVDQTSDEDKEETKKPNDIMLVIYYVFILSHFKKYC